MCIYNPCKYIYNNILIHDNAEFILNTYLSFRFFTVCKYFIIAFCLMYVCILYNHIYRFFLENICLSYSFIYCFYTETHLSIYIYENLRMHNYW